MGWLIPKTYLKWREPKSVRQVRDAMDEKVLPVWVLPLTVVASSAFFNITLCLPALNPKNTLPLPIALPVASAVGILFVYILLWFLGFCPSEVIVTDTRIRRIIGNRFADWEYKHLRSCQIVSR